MNARMGHLTRSFGQGDLYLEDHLNMQKGILEQTRIGFVLVYFFSCIISSSLIMLAKLRGGGHLLRVLCGYQP